MFCTRGLTAYMFNNLSKQSRDFAVEFRKVPYSLLIKKRNHGNSLKRRDLLASNSTRFICTNLGRIRSLDLMQMNLVHSVPINLFWENSLDFFRLEVRKHTLMHIQWNSVIMNSVANEHSVITKRFSGQIGKSSIQIDPVITNPGYNEQKWPVPRCSL
jgi:hypothetical protein